jgi:hypothetical protein
MRIVYYLFGADCGRFPPAPTHSHTGKPPNSAQNCILAAGSLRAGPSFHRGDPELLEAVRRFQRVSIFSVTSIHETLQALD